jgi:hypothetical protein
LPHTEEVRSTQEFTLHMRRIDAWRVLAVTAIFSTATLFSTAYPVSTALFAAQAPQAAPAQQSAPAVLPDAREVIQRHIEAIGGREAVMAHSSRHVTGTMSMPSTGLTGSFEMFEAKPNKAVMRMTLPGLGEFNEGFNGEIAWSINPVAGPTLLEGRQLEEKKLDADFFGDLNFEKRYASMKTVERVDFDGRSCYKVQLVRRDGGEDVQFYDLATGLRAGSIVNRETPLGSMNATIVEADYKRFGKVLYPTKLTNTAMNQQQVLIVENVRFDTVKPSDFEPPAVIKALIK